MNNYGKITIFALAIAAALLFISSACRTASEDSAKTSFDKNRKMLKRKMPAEVTMRRLEPEGSAERIEMKVVPARDAQQLIFDLKLPEGVKAKPAPPVIVENPRRGEEYSVLFSIAGDIKPEHRFVAQARMKIGEGLILGQSQGFDMGAEPRLAPEQPFEEGRDVHGNPLREIEAGESQAD